MTTLTEKELMSLNGEEKQDASFATVTADNFVGHLTGVADNAKRLYESQRLVLQGDVSGATDIGQGNTSIDVTVNHAKNADVATSCGYATDSLNASHADLANIATFAHTADKAVDAEHAKESDHSKETDHSLLADNATNANHADVSSEANHAADSDHAILSDTATVALKDNKDRELDKTIDDIISKELADTTALQSAIDDTNNVINNEVKVKLDDHEQRLSNLETTTDIGKLNERIVKIEELNEQQDSRLDSIDTLNTEQNTRLDNVESLANSTATTVTENKNAVDTQINNLKQEDTTLSNRITNLDTTHTQDIERLDNSDTNLQEQITLQVQSFNSHKEDENAHSNLLHYTDTNAHSELFAQCVKSVNGVNADENGNVKIANVSKEIGEIFYSTIPMDNVNYHLLDGTILDGNAEEYKQFYNYLLSIKPTYSSLFIAEEDYQTQLNDKGVCGKYVLDEVSKTIRLPKITGFIEGTVDSSALGELVEAGLPNITGSITVSDSSYKGSLASGAFTLSSYEKDACGWSDDQTKAVFNFDASRSSSIYGNSTTVQPQSIKLFVYVVVSKEVVEDAPLDVTKEYQLNNPFSLFDYRYVSHRLNNASWVLSTNAFLSGDLYPSAYEKLLAELNESSIGLSVKSASDVYTDYDYVVDTENNSFRLPLVIKERVLVESKVATDEDPTWYNLYSDGWIEQGGLSTQQVTNGSPISITLLKDYLSTDYYIQTGSLASSVVPSSSAPFVTCYNLTTSGFSVCNSSSFGVRAFWYACGYAQDKPTTNLYFYLGDTVSNPSLIELGFVQDRIGRIESKIGNLSKVGGMPDYSSGIDITSSLNKVNMSWTAPKNGIVQACVANHQFVYLYRKYDVTHAKSLEQAFIALDGEGGICMSDNMSIQQNYTIYASSDINNNGTIMFYPYK